MTRPLTISFYPQAELGHQGDAYTKEILSMYATFEALMGKPNEASTTTAPSSKKTDNQSLHSVDSNSPASSALKSMLSSRTESVTTPRRRLLPTCPPIPRNRFPPSSPSSYGSLTSTNTSQSSLSSTRIPYAYTSSASSIDFHDGKVTLSPVNKFVRFEKRQYNQASSTAGIHLDKNSPSVSPYSAHSLYSEEQSEYTRNRLKVKRSILRDPLLDSMRSHVRGNDNNKTAAGIEDEIDSILYGGHKNDPEDSYHPVTDIIPCLEVPYVSMIEDRYRSQLQLPHYSTSSQSSRNLEEFRDDSLDSVERLVMEDIVDSMGLTGSEARQVLREKLGQQQQNTTPPFLSETDSISSDASRNFAPGMMLIVRDKSRRGSSSTETSEDSCRQTSDSLSSRTSPHISAIIEKHLRGKRQKSVDATKRNFYQSLTTHPQLHIYEEVYHTSSSSPVASQFTNCLNF
jgi:hypothetical protein